MLRVANLRRNSLALAAGIAATLFFVHASSSSGETRLSIPPVEESVLGSWFGVDDDSPHPILKLVLKNDGTGFLMKDHFDSPLVWEIREWKVPPGTRDIEITFAPSDEPQQLTAKGSYERLFIEFTQRTTDKRDPKKGRFFERTIWLYPEDKIRNALNNFDKAARSD